MTLAALYEQAYAVVDAATAARLAEGCPLAREEAVFGGENLQLHTVEGGWLLRERDDRGRIYLRAFRERVAADHFIDQRLAQYEKLWDG